MAHIKKQFRKKIFTLMRSCEQVCEPICLVRNDEQSCADVATDSLIDKTRTEGKRIACETILPHWSRTTEKFSQFLFGHLLRHRPLASETLEDADALSLDSQACSARGEALVKQFPQNTPTLRKLPYIANRHERRSFCPTCIRLRCSNGSLEASRSGRREFCGQHCSAVPKLCLGERLKKYSCRE